jgi:chromosome segregation ATPase
MTTAIRSALLPGFVRSAVPEQHEARIRMSEIDGQLSSLVGQLNPQRAKLTELRNQHESLWKKQRKAKKPSSELNERMAEILADMTDIHRKMQPIVENIEILNGEYAQLQNRLMGKS